MKRLMVFVLIFCFIGTMGYGCIKSSKPDQTNENEVILNNKEDNSSSISKEELQNGLIEKTDYTNRNDNLESDQVTPEMLYEHVVIEGKDVFYITQYDMYGEGNNGHFVIEAYDKDGKRAWMRKWLELEIGELPMGSEPIVDGDVVYVGVNGNLAALDLGSGDLIWEAHGTGSTTKPLVYEDSVYIASYDSPFLTSVNKVSGKINWTLSKTDHLSPIKTWRWKNSIWVACESASPGVIQYVKVGLHGDIIDYRGYARYDETSPFFATEASSYKGSETEVMLPDNAFDTDVETAWCATNDENGVGEWIRFSADQEKVIHGITMYNGHHGSYIDAQENGKAEMVRIDFSNGDSIIYEFKNKNQLMGVEKIVLTDIVVAYKMKLTILKVTPGKSDGVCISEIVID